MKVRPKTAARAALAIGVVLALNAGGPGAVAAPPDPGGVLDPIASNASGTQAKATAHFSPAHKGQSVKLQALTIVTTNTDEVKTATWKTLATAKEDAKGDVAFAIDDPLEVSHSYRAVTDEDPALVSNEVTFAAPATTKNT